MCTVQPRRLRTQLHASQENCNGGARTETSSRSMRTNGVGQLVHQPVAAIDFPHSCVTLFVKLSALFCFLSDIDITVTLLHEKMLHTVHCCTLNMVVLIYPSWNERVSILVSYLVFSVPMVRCRHGEISPNPCAES